MNLQAFPRMLGFGRCPIDQVYFESWEKAKVAIANAMNERSIFFALYPFKMDGGTKYYQVDKISFDLEHPNKLENPLWEGRRIASLGKQIGADVVLICTRRGLHAHLLLAPTWVVEKEAIKRIGQLQLKIINHLKLRTVCWDSIGDAAKLLRWPDSIYQDKHGMVWPIRCIEIFPEDEAPELKKERARQDYRKFDHQKARKMAKIDALEMILGNTLPAQRPCQALKEIELPGDFKQAEILPQVMIFSKPCVRYWLSTGNPPPYIRFFAVIYLKKLGKSIEEITHWFGTIGMADYDYNLTKKYVERAFEKYAYLPSHRKLRGRGFCLREGCPEYRPELEEKGE